MRTLSATARTLTVSTVGAVMLISAHCDAALIYWTSRFDQSIRLSNSQTLTTSTVVSSPGLDPWGITVDELQGSIYFTSGFNAGDPDPRVMRVGTGGMSLQTLTTSNSAVRQIELDLAAGYMFWAAEGGFGGGDGDTIYRANLDGSGVTALATGLWNPRAMAIDASSDRLYWDSFNPANSTRTIFRSDYDGSNLQAVISGESSSIWGMDLDVSAGKLYWGDAAGKLVRRSNLDGTGAETILSGLNFDVLDVQIDFMNDHLYIAGDNFNGAPGGKIMRSQLDGSNLTTLFDGVNATNIYLATAPATVPEPTSMAMWGVGLAICGIARRRRLF